jgi:hypothetical protein
VDNLTTERRHYSCRSDWRHSRTLLAICCVTICLACTRAGESQIVTEPVRIEIWCRGDDGLTQRFRAELEAALRDTDGFTLASGGEATTARTLVVTIDNHLSWQHVEANTQVSYAITFQGPNAEVLGSSVGSCWEGDLSACVRRAVIDTQQAAKKVA